MKKVDIATSTEDINHSNNITNFDTIGNDNDIGIIKQKINICKIFKYASIGKVKIIFAPWSSNIFLLIGPQWYLFILLILIAIPSFIFFYMKIFPLLLSSFFSSYYSPICTYHSNIIHNCLFNRSWGDD